MHLQWSPFPAVQKCSALPTSPPMSRPAQKHGNPGNCLPPSMLYVAFLSKWPPRPWQCHSSECQRGSDASEPVLPVTSLYRLNPDLFDG